MAQPASLVVAPARVGTEELPPDTSDRRIPLSFEARPSAPEAPEAPGPVPLAWLLRAGLLAVAVAAPFLAFGGQKDVSLDVEGRTVRLSTYAASSEELLERAGVPVGRNDLVRPIRTPVRSGTVTYRRAKQISVIVDDRPREVVAHGLTVREALASLGLHPGPKDHVSPSLEDGVRDGMNVRVRNAVTAKVRVDGRLRDVVSSGETVTELLREAGIRVGESDYVLPSKTAKPNDAMWIRVVRVRRVVAERSVRVPFEVVTRSDPSLDSGARKIVQQGAEGIKVRRTRTTYEDGVLVSSTVLSESITRSPRNHIVTVGTKEPAFEGGGRSQTGVASWFHADGLVAAHPSLPMGTIVRVTNTDNGKSVNVRIADRGPTVEGRIVDLSDDAFRRVASLDDGTFNARIDW